MGPSAISGFREENGLKIIKLYIKLKSTYIIKIIKKEKYILAVVVMRE